MKPHSALLVLPLLLASCDKKDDDGASTSDKQGESSSRNVANDTVGASAEPTLNEWISIDNLGLQIKMPAGSEASTTDGIKDRYAQIERDDFVVSVFIANECNAVYGELIKRTPNTISFPLNETHEGGWAIVQKLNSPKHNAVRFEANVFVTIGDRGFVCGAFEKSAARARTVTDACRTLKSL
jgi:hypothetical protein